MPRDILQNLINHFSIEEAELFFRRKSDQFNPSARRVYADLTSDRFHNPQKLGEIVFDGGGEKLIVVAAEARDPLTERSGKKAQYDTGKTILKAEYANAGIFIFYDGEGAFRFSLIYPQPIGNRRVWSNFRRFTYFVSRELANKTFLQQIAGADFGTLEKIKEAFSVEAVTKEFYKEIANWYFWAVDNCAFPKDAEEQENGRQMAIIRLITRLVFIWFMRERRLIPRELFEEKNVSRIINDMSPHSATYYKAILQNLFFATLSTKKKERKFGSEVRGHKGKNPDFGNQYVYRYHELFHEPRNIQEYFGEIPFLNGGLFECLDEGEKDVYIDGFTRRKQFQPRIPNILFFSQEQRADLNTAYGTQNKKYKVRGIIDILSSYNFTIDENDPNDAEIALDPELLGKVFENLLANFNPETGATARKATGSYYTPREIVDYMVTQSLKEYLKTHLMTISSPFAKLNILFEASASENPFDADDTKRIVHLIDNLRIVDPAVGSGAFPMGILNKLVFLLSKLDPDNQLWKEAQLTAARAIPDPKSRQNAIASIEKNFSGKNVNYGRKLYLIQKCIYGVDIQPIDKS